jgi:tetratricopeptide (TPR) repeat protein
MGNSLFSQTFSAKTYTDSIENYPVFRLKNEMFSLKLEAIIASNENNSQGLEITNHKIILASEKMISLTGKSGSLLYDIGRSYYSLGNYIKAIPFFTEALNYPDEKGKNYEFRGYSKKQMKDYRGAIKDFENALINQEPTPAIFFNKGFCYMVIGDYPLAASDYSKAIKMDSENGLYYYYRGVVNLQMNKKVEGCNDLSNAGNYGYGEAYELISKYCN